MNELTVASLITLNNEAVQELINAGPLVGAAQLLARSEDWERRVAAVLENGEHVPAIDRFRFRVLGWYTPRGIEDKDPKRAFVRELVVERYHRLNTIIAKLEGALPVA